VTRVLRPVLIFLMVAVSANAHAALLTFRVQGTVFDVSDSTNLLPVRANVGDQFVYEFTLETNTPETSGTLGTAGLAQFQNAITSARVTIGTNATIDYLAPVGSRSSTQIADNFFPTYDFWSSGVSFATNGDPSGAIPAFPNSTQSVNLQLPGPFSMLAGEALVGPPSTYYTTDIGDGIGNVSIQANQLFSSSSPDGLRAFIFARVTSITQVPAPSGLGLLVFGLAAIALTRSNRAQLAQG
jgi:hypothetical protein